MGASGREHKRIPEIVGLLAISLTVAALAFATPQPADQPIAGGAFEASGVVSVDAGRGVLFVDDNDDRHVIWMPLNSDGVQSGPTIRIPLGIRIIDQEGMTSDGDYFYAIGSQSKPGAPMGVGLIRFRFDVTTRRVRDVEHVRDLKRFLAAATPELGAHETLRGDDRFNIEGLAWDPDGKRLLIGLRAPVIRGQAVVLPVTLRNPKGPLTSANLQVGDVIPLPLGGAGIRSIEYDANRKHFLVITGAPLNAENRDFVLWAWDPKAATPLTEVRRFPARLKPEGITRASLPGSDPLMLVFDTSRYQAIR